MVLPRDAGQALLEAPLRTISNGLHTKTVGTSVTTLDLTDPKGDGTVDLRGQWVEFQARVGSITILRGNVAGIVSKVGHVIRCDADDATFPGPSEPFFVPASLPDATIISLIADTADSKLDFLYDTTLNPE